MKLTEVPKVKVGVMSDAVIEFELHGSYSVDGEAVAAGRYSAAYSNGKVQWQGKEYVHVLFQPGNEREDSFTLIGVTIGVNFHWERKEDQTFRGALDLIVEGDKLTTVNILSVEDYLTSVISSEMSANASLELLKAHAVISRSWLLAQIEKNQRIAQSGEAYQAQDNAEGESIKWWDREDHVNFDVCADDHCQRYQGITRQSTKKVEEAIAATYGEVVCHAGELCDARFSKSCGGVYEQFENCWEQKHFDYLVAKRDAANENDFPDLTKESNAEEWILTTPKAYCNTRDGKILSQVLNNYDQETTDFYRWTVEYSQEEIAALIRNRSGIDYGRIYNLEPVARGTSGRLYKLKIVGEKLTQVIGKELHIRRTLSPSHLYSSAFVVERHEVDADGFPKKFVLRGAGWGHGVGLCQIGAAVMGEQGYDYKQILLHYFIGASIDKYYPKN